MKILIFNWRDITHAWTGGAERHLHELAKEWVKNGHTVTLLAGGYKGALKKEVIDGIEIIKVGNTYSIFFLASLSYLLKLRKRNYDILIDTSHGIPFFARFYSRRPMILIVHHNHEKLWKSEFGKYISRLGIFIENKLITFFYRNVMTITLSETTKDELKKIGFKKVEAVAPGIDSQYYSPGKDKFSKPTILYLGRLRKYKRVEILLDAYSKIAEKIPDVSLIIAGTGQDKDRLEHIARKKNIYGKVQFKGFISEEEKLSLLQKSWVLAFPSLIEGWGLVAMEAAACGTPTIGFRVPGLQDAIKDGESGNLVDTKEEFTEAIINLLKDKNSLNKLSQGAVKWAEKFNWQKSAKQFENIMEHEIHPKESPLKTENEISAATATYILGLHLSHNSTACLLKDGKIMGCVSEERFNRKKNYTGFPKDAVKYLLESENITPNELSYVVHAGEALTLGWVPVEDKKHPIKKYLFAVYYLMSLSPLLDSFIRQIHYIATKASSQNQIFDQITQNIPGVSEKILYAPHHHCHAYAAFYGTVKQAERQKNHLILTHDGEGDMLCGLIMKSENGQLKKIDEIRAGNSIAAIYGNVTDLMGMKINEHEYKIMGLSPYTSEYETKKVYPLFDKLIKIKGTQIKSLFGQRGGYMYLQRVLINKRFDGIAGAAQKLVEEKISEWISNVIAKENINSIVLGGGLFMNVKANKLIGDMSEVSALSICPSAADESNAIGATYWAYEKVCKEQNKDFNPQELDNLYLGPEFSDEEIEKTLRQERIYETYKVKKSVSIEKDIAELLSKGEVVARFAGRSEFGARALGNRSIMADPRSPEIIRTINEQIKSRDFWMPFASSILEERADDYLVNPKKLRAPFMILAFDTTDLGRNELKAAIHPYDFTSRPQIVAKNMNPRYYDIIKHFEKLTGVGGILNTSFNIHGEPIVGSPHDALNTFKNSGLNVLAIENYLIFKNETPVV